MKRSALGMAVLIVFASTAFANEGKGGRWFDRLDANGDGIVTQAETDAHQSERFNEKDANGDGMISREEFSVRAHDRFARSDADGNGEITKEEFRGAMKEWRKKHGKAE